MSRSSGPLRSSTAPLRLALGGALLIGGGVGLGRFLYTPILPTMAAALSLSPGQAGLIASANFAGYLGGALIAGAPLFSRSPRTWLFLALALSALSTAAMGLVSSLTAFLTLRAIGGVASAFVLVLASAQVLNRLAETGREDLAWVHFAGVGSAIVLSAFAIALAPRGSDWRGFWLGGGVLIALCLGAAALVLPAGPGRSAASAAEKTGSAPPRSAVLLLWAYGLFGFGYVVTATFIVAIVKTYPAAEPVRPYVWMLVGAAAIPSVGLWTRVGLKIGVLPAFCAACVLEAFGVGVSVLRPTAGGAVTASLLLGGTYMGVTALGLVAARSLQPGAAARVLGRMTAAFGLGQMVGPGFAGWLAGRTGGFGVPSLIASGALVLAAALAFPWKLRRI